MTYKVKINSLLFSELACLAHIFDILLFITLNIDCWDRKLKIYQANTKKTLKFYHFNCSISIWKYKLSRSDVRFGIKTKLDMCHGTRMTPHFNAGHKRDNDLD